MCRVATVHHLVNAVGEKLKEGQGGEIIIVLSYIRMGLTSFTYGGAMCQTMACHSSLLFMTEWEWDMTGRETWTYL
jgi:hypothetical protein